MNAHRGLRAQTGHRVGEWHHRAKLSDAQVIAIRERYRRAKRRRVRLGYARLARAFGCGASTVRDIVKRRTRASV